MTRDRITIPELAGMPPTTPVTLVSSVQGYAVAVGPAERVRWLHSATGTFRLFPRADRAIAFLHAAGVRRVTLDLSGGTPQ